MSLKNRIYVLGFLALLPVALSYTLGKPWESMAQVAGYYSSLLLVYITLLYVDATQSMLSHAETQADATQEQAAIARAQIEATQAALLAAERDREERFKPVLVPITDLTNCRKKLDQPSFAGAPIAIENIGNAAALNISVTAGFLGGYASNPAQPFKVPSLAAGDATLLGSFTSTGMNPVGLILKETNYKIQCTDILGTAYEFECENGVISQKRKAA